MNEDYGSPELLLNEFSCGVKFWSSDTDRVLYGMIILSSLFKLKQASWTHFLSSPTISTRWFSSKKSNNMVMDKMMINHSISTVT